MKNKKQEETRQEDGESWGGVGERAKDLHAKVGTLHPNQVEKFKQEQAAQVQQHHHAQDDEEDPHVTPRRDRDIPQGTQKQEQKKKSKELAAIRTNSNAVDTCVGWRVLVTGGASLLARRLTERLISQGAVEVRLVDVKEGFEVPSDIPLEMRDRVSAFQIDIVQIRALEKVLKGMDTVFHIASFGMNGVDALNVRQTGRVNIAGTRNLLKNCLYCGVKRLVYTSTYNVVFGGYPAKPIENGTEKMPYLELEEHCDAYSRSKTSAEEMVLRAGSQGARLAACAIRPATIYGEGETSQFPRIVRSIKAGRFTWRLGAEDAKQDWVHVDDLADAHILAARNLVIEDDNTVAGIVDREDGEEEEEGNSVNQEEEEKGEGKGEGEEETEEEKKEKEKTRKMLARRARGQLKHGVSAGEVYFINDGEPVNTFTFLEPVVKAFGQSPPTRSLSYTNAMRIAHIQEIVYLYLNKIWAYTPSITRCEVNKCAVQHTFSTKKAARELGFAPKVKQCDGIKRMIEYLLEENRKPTVIDWEVGSTNRQSTATILSLLVLLLAVVLAAIKYVPQLAFLADLLPFKLH